jgi:hypothetical protein
MERLLDCDTMLQFTFTNLNEDPKRIITFKNGSREVCDKNSGYEVDVYFRSTLRALSEVWWGENSILAACESEKLKATGPPAYTKNLSH